MSGKTGRKQQGQQPRRQRAKTVQQRGQEKLGRVLAAEGGEPSAVLPALDPRPHPATTLPPPAPRRTGTGQRAPGQRIACGWCGQPITIRARGPLPRWCSPSCRHRAWEQTRAAHAGLAAVHVHDRYVQAIPNDTKSWIDQLDTLGDQLSFTDTGGPIPYRDLDQLAAALDRVQAALESRRHRLPPYRPD